MKHGTGLLFSFTATEEVASIYFFINNAESNDCVATISNVMVMSGSHSTAETYEPYTDGPAPNPSYPQEVKVVRGNQKITLINKNIARLELEGRVRSYANGIPYATSSFNGYIANVKPNTTYISSCQNISTQYTEISNLCYFDDNMNFLSGNAYNGRNKTFTTPSNCKYASIAVKQTIVNFQLEQGSSATSYIAHQEQNYELNLGKNLFDKNSNIVTPGYLNANGEVVTTDATLSYQDKFIKVQPSTTYTISSDTSTIYRIAEYNSSQTFISRNFNANASKSYSFTTSNNTHYIKMAGTLTSVLNSLQIEEGSQATSYASYFPPIELAGINNVRDEIYELSQKWYVKKRIGKTTWNGTENWQTNPGISTTYVISRPTDLAFADNNVFYNYFCTVADLSVATQGARIGSSINLKNPNTADLASFKTWLSTHNVEMYYQSTTPTDTEITYEPLIDQLNAIKDARLYDGITNIITEGNLPVIFSGKTYTTESTELTIENEGNIYARPKLTLTGIGDISIYLNGSQIFILNLDREAPETIIIDCENMDAFYDGVLKNRKVTGDYSNFKLQPGNNQIAVSGAVADLKVETYSRWL